MIFCVVKIVSFLNHRSSKTNDYKKTDEVLSADAAADEVDREGSFGEHVLSSRPELAYHIIQVKSADIAIYRKNNVHIILSIH